MKILRQGHPAPMMRGTCVECGTEIEVEHRETKELIDRDTQPGMATRYVTCPTKHCQNLYLWVLPVIKKN